MVNNKLKIEIHDYEGGYEEYGTITKVNGEEMPFRNTDREAIITMILQYLGYDVDVVNT